MTQSPDITKIPSDRLFISYHWSDLAARQKIKPLLLRQKAKPPVAPPPDGLRTPAEAARKLRCSVKTLFGHVASGALRYVAIGHGTKRPRKRFADADLDAFIESQTRKDVPCPSTRTESSPYFHFDFQVRGHRFHGSTKCTTRREAEKVEAAEREKARALVAQLAAAKTSLKLDDVAERWWQEVGQYHAGADGTEHQLALVVEFFTKDKLITDITGDDVARIVAWRRGHRRQDGALISSHTVNRTTKQLRKLFTRTKLW